MQFTTYVLRNSALAALFLGGPLAVHATPVMDKPSFPTIIYWDNWTDQKGISHLTKCRITAFHPLSVPHEPKNRHDDTVPQALIWNGVKRNSRGYATVATIVQPRGWKGTWHSTQHVQWIVSLAGVYSVEAMDGTRVELNPGDILLHEDIGSVRDSKGHQGHLSGNVGNEAVALISTRLLGQRAAIRHPCTLR